MTGSSRKRASRSNIRASESDFFGLAKKSDLQICQSTDCVAKLATKSNEPCRLNLAAIEPD